MRIGVPRETKNHEYRVGMTPSSVRELVHHGHAMLVETNAGHAIGLDDAHYIAAGAQIAPDAASVFAAADMIVKVKEPQAIEFALLRQGRILFTYLHLAPDRKQTRALMEAGVTAIAYETVTDARGGLPLLAPMSMVAGRMAIQVGAHALEIRQGGRGQLLGGVPGVPPAHVVVLGGGVVGTNAARMALALDAQVTVVDKSLSRLYDLAMQYGPALRTAYATIDTIEDLVLQADLVVGAVLVPGAAAPRLVTAEQVKRMRRGAVMVDVSIDQGGCFETSRPTTHADPTYVVDGVVHYCVTNMPGAVARTSTFALNNATLPFIMALADKGWRGAMRGDPHLANGLNVLQGRLINPAVANALAIDHLPLARALEG